MLVVTGAAGFIGRHVVRRLLRAGHDVVGIDRRSWRPRPGERALVADLATDRRDVGAALRAASGVVHLAARPGVRDRTPGIDRLRQHDNVVAGARVLTAVPDAVPIAVASSSSVYGGAGDPRRPRASRESDPLDPVGGYAASKVALEALCHERAARGGRVVVARPFTVAGEGQRDDMALALWIDAVRRGAPVTVLGGLDRRRDVTDVVDVARAMVELLEVAGRTPAGGAGRSPVVNLGTGSPHRLADLVAAVERAVGATAHTRLRPAGPAEVAVTCADTTRCRELLGWAPRTDLERLVARQAAARRHPAALPARSRWTTAATAVATAGTRTGSDVVALRRVAVAGEAPA